MANEEQLSILKQGVGVWNKWRENNPDISIDLCEADLRGANLRGMNLSRADLYEAYLANSDLEEADLSEAKLSEADLYKANLSKANLNKAELQDAYLWETILVEANLIEADLSRTSIMDADFSSADLRRSDLTYANISGGKFINADLMGANIFGAKLFDTDFSETNMTRVNLAHSSLIEVRVSNAQISESNIYGISIWGLDGDFKEQKELIITPLDEARVTVDNIKVAQFIYMLLDNKEIRDAINTLTSKTVLILGRFAVPERKIILDALRDKLREYNLLPVVFDFDRPKDKDFTETIKTLAGISYFVIADVTNPKSSPLELQAIVPDYQTPFVPIIQEGEKPFAMMVDLQKKYNWVLKTITYDSMETLIKVLKPLIIDPAMKKRQELRLIKAQEPEVISAKDFLAKGGL